MGAEKTWPSGVVRAIGDPELRFREDKLRMLRAVRFAARFGYVIEPRTFEAIRELAAEINQVSRERVRDELTKRRTEGHAKAAFELLDGQVCWSACCRRSIACMAWSSRRNIIPKATSRSHHVAAGKTLAESPVHFGLVSAAARCG